jgi:hypothetical protein
MEGFSRPVVIGLLTCMILRTEKGSGGSRT